MYPVSLDIDGKLCLVVGGGRVAARKARGLLAAGAQVRVISPALHERMEALLAEEGIEWQRKAFAAEDVEGAFLVLPPPTGPRSRLLCWRRPAPTICSSTWPTIPSTVISRSRRCCAVAS